jgi:hypothetical protein
MAPAPRPLLMTRFEIGGAGAIVGHVQIALTMNLAVDAMALDHGEYLRGRVPQCLVQPRALGGAQGRLDVVGADPGAGIDQPDIAPGAAMADLVGFEHHHPLALLEQPDGRAQAGDAGADDADIGL